jgi:hypothetical protein
LVDEDPRNMVLITDLLHLPKNIYTKVLSHPVITTFIEKKWLQTRWTFAISFTLYLLFVLLFSSFLWLMYERYGENDIIRIPVKRPRSCDHLQPIMGSLQENGKKVDSRMFGFDLETIDITSAGVATREGNIKDTKDEDVFELH